MFVITCYAAEYCIWNGGVPFSWLVRSKGTFSNLLLKHQNYIIYTLITARLHICVEINGKKTQNLPLQLTVRGIQSLWNKRPLEINGYCSYAFFDHNPEVVFKDTKVWPSASDRFSSVIVVSSMFFVYCLSDRKGAMRLCLIYKRHILKGCKEVCILRL